MLKRTLLVAAAALALAASAQAVPPTNGTYSGRTDQSRAVTFRIKGGKVLAFQAGVLTYCTTQGDNRFETDAIANLPAIPVVGNRFHLKKDILHFRRLVAPQREVTHRLSRGEFPQISKEDAILFRDVYDRVYRVSEMLESFRDVLAGALEVYLTIVANRTNEVMRVLTVFSIILMATSLLAGIYGMNFESIPFAKHSMGFWTIVGLMGVMAFALLLVFRKRRWI